jgi:hypothetical protein
MGLSSLFKGLAFRLRDRESGRVGGRSEKGGMEGGKEAHLDPPCLGGSGRVEGDDEGAVARVVSCWRL